MVESIGLRHRTPMESHRTYLILSYLTYLIPYLILSYLTLSNAQKWENKELHPGHKYIIVVHGPGSPFDNKT